VSEPPWKRLVEDLSAKGHQSPHLDRLRDRLPQGQGYRTLELEMMQEMASALGRASEKVDHALLELEVIGIAVDTAKDAPTRAVKVSAFNQQREVALKALWELKVHREALGFRQHQVLAQFYPVPPKRT
jgi:hypothetical protein